MVDSELGPLLSVMKPLQAKITSDTAAFSAILAMAWAISGPFVSAQDNMHRARKKYIQVISRLQKAVQSPSLATDDATLLAVLLVGLIEVLTATSQAMPQPGKHINAAITLINLRGSQNFANHSAKKMLSFVKLKIAANPVSHRLIKVPLNHEILRLDRDSRDETSNDPNDAPLRLGNLAFTVCNLREAIEISLQSSHNSANLSGYASMIQKSLELDQALLAWRQTIPASWEISSRICALNERETACSNTWLGHTAIYPTFHIAEMFNQFRMLRITLQNNVIKCASKMAAAGRLLDLPGSFIDISTVQKEAAYVCLEMVNEICASVPFHLGNLPSMTPGPTALDPGPTSLSHSQPCLPTSQAESTACDSSASTCTGRTLGTRVQPPSGQPPFVKNMGCYMLLQPLMMAQSVAGLSDRQQSWILNQAREICKRTGMDLVMVQLKFNEMKSLMKPATK